MKWWRDLSKGRKYATCMGLAFGPLAVFGILIQFGFTLPAWIMIPVFCVCGLFSAIAYGIRISS